MFEAFFVNLLKVPPAPRAPNATKVELIPWPVAVLRIYNFNCRDLSLLQPLKFSAKGKFDTVDMCLVN